MIKRLTVKDYLIFEAASVEFDGGFNVLSGETGAGKSLLIDAISLLSGRRVDWDSVPRRAYLEMVMEGDETLARALSDLGIPYDGEVVVRRTLNPETRRSRILLNDMHVSAGVVRRLLQGRIFVGSQFAHTGVDDPHFQTEVLDRFAGVDYGEYPILYAEYRAKINRLRKLESRLSELKEREDYLRFQLDGLRKLNLHEGEEEELLKRREELEEIIKAQEWSLRFREVYPSLRESITSLLRDAPERFRGDLENVLNVLTDMAMEVPDEGEEDLQEEFDRINARLYEIGRLKSRFRTDFEGLLRLTGTLEAELRSIRELEDEVVRLRHELNGLITKLEKAASRISDQRSKYLKEFAGYVEDNLRALGFEYVKVEVRMEETDFHPSGRDVVVLLVSTVPDVPPHPVSGLSGGELSRTALVLFSTGASRFRTLILDEIDMGVSPSVADRIGRLLKDLSGQVQVIAITHQAFTAMHADKHLVVERLSPSEAVVREVTGEDRWKELARMMGVKDPDMARITLGGE